MKGERQVDQGALFYEFSLEKHLPADHLLRAIDRFVDLGEVRPHLAPFYSTTGRPSVDPELLIRMLIIGYCYGIRSVLRRCIEEGLVGGDGLCGRRQPDQGRCQPPEGRRRCQGLGAGGVGPRGRRVSGRAR
jgi:hypothetical protein